jgi:predicted RNA-binding Zn-ribbon protein involved in translation (DUF1610 family)
MIDHRASPGLPEDIARATGLDPAFAGEGKLLEHATLTCSHCKASVVKNPLRTRERANCPQCGNHYICDFCEAERHQADYVHTPYDKLADDTIDAAHLGMMLGSPRGLMDG